MQPRDRLDNAQSETNAGLRFSRYASIEALRHTRLLGFRDAGAIVGYDDADHPVRLASGVQRDGALVGYIPDGVVYEVAYRLRDQMRVAMRRQSAWCIDDERSLFFLGKWGIELGDLGYGSS